MLASKALRPTLHARRGLAQHAASAAAAAVRQRSRLPSIPTGAGAGAAGYHQQAPGGGSIGGSGSMPWTPPSASWWATRKRPSSSLGALNYPHVAPDPLADPSIFDEINAYSLKRQTGVSLKTLLDTGAWAGWPMGHVGWLGGSSECVFVRSIQNHRAGPPAPEAVLREGGERHRYAADAPAGPSVALGPHSIQNRRDTHADPCHRSIHQCTTTGGLLPAPGAANTAGAPRAGPRRHVRARVSVSVSVCVDSRDALSEVDTTHARRSRILIHQYAVHPPATAP